MSEKNFVAYGDAESILTGYANRIKQSPTTFVGTQAQWNALSSSQKAKYELVDITDDSLSLSGLVDWRSNGELGAKNLIENTSVSKTEGNVQYTVNADKSISINILSSLSANAGRIVGYINVKAGLSYTLRGGISSAIRIDLRNSDYSMWMDNVQNKEVTSPKQSYSVDTFIPSNDATVMVYLRIDSSIATGNVGTVYPLLRYATDTDETYQPYAMTNKELTKQVAPIDDMNNILGAKNLLPVTMATQVLSGVTFTVDASSGVISVSGSNSGNPFSDVLGITTLTPGTYKVTTGQTPELNAQIGIAITDASSGTIIARSWNGTEVFTISSNTQVRFHIEVNVTGAITSTSIYPMCRPSSIKDEKYAPYAPTNRALTLRVSSFEKKFNTQVKMTVQPNTTYFNAASSQSCGALKIGYLVVMNLVLSVKDNVTVPANTLACTITDVGAISANSSIFIGGNGASNITRLVLRRNESNNNNLDVFFIDSYSNSSMRASLVFMVNTIV